MCSLFLLIILGSFSGSPVISVNAFEISSFFRPDCFISLSIADFVLLSILPNIALLVSVADLSCRSICSVVSCVSLSIKPFNASALEPEPISFIPKTFIKSCAMSFGSIFSNSLSFVLFASIVFLRAL